MATLSTHTLVAGFYDGYTDDYRGFRDVSYTNTNIGTFDGVTTGPALSGSWSVSIACDALYTINNTSGVTMVVEFDGPSSTTTQWYDMRVGSNTYNRVDASVAYPGTPSYYTTRYTWFLGYVTQPINSGSTYTITFTDDGTTGSGIVAPTVHDTMSNHTVATTASATTTVDIALSATGSGGTLEYNVSTTTTLPTTGWTTGDPSVTRGTAYYLWARRSSTDYDRSANTLSIPYLSPDTTLSTIADVNIGTQATSFSISIVSGGANDVYQVRNRAGTETHESRTGNGTITVTDAPAVGGSKDYSVYVRKPTAAGGNNTYADVGTEADFTVTRAGYVSPDTTITVSPSGDHTVSSTSFTVDVTNANSNGVTDYRLVVSGTTTALDSYTSTGTSFTLETTSPSPGNSEDYVIQARVPTADDGNDTWVDAHSFTVTRASTTSTGGATTNYSHTTTSYFQYSKNVFNDDKLVLSWTPAGADLNKSWAVQEVTGGAYVSESPNAGFFHSGHYYPAVSEVTFTSVDGQSYDIVYHVSTYGGSNNRVRFYGTISDPYKVTNVTFTGSADQTPGTANVVSNSQTFNTLRSGETLDFVVTNGSLEKNGSGTWETSGTINDDDTYKLRGNASQTYGGTTTVTVTLSKNAVTKATETFVINTEDLTAPTNLTFVNDNDSSATEQVTVTASGGTGGTLKVSNDGTTWYANGTKFNHTRGSSVTYYARREGLFSQNSANYTENHIVYPTDPTDLTFVNDVDASATEQVTVTASGGYGGTLKVSNDGTTWYANGTKFDHARNSTVTYYAKRDSTYDSGNYTENHSVGYLAPAAYSYSVTDSDPLAYGDTGFSVTFSGTDADHGYRVLYGATSAGTRTTDGNILISGAELPSPGGIVTYSVQAFRSTTIGGSGSYITSATFTRSMRPSNPTLSASTATTAAATATVTLTASSVGATEYRFSTDGTTYSAWQSSGSYTVETQTRGTSYTYYVQARSANVSAASTTSLNYTVPYLSPLAFSYSVSDSDPLGYGDTGFNVTISGADTDHTYRVLADGVDAGTRTSDGNILISGSELPSAGGRKLYTVQVKRGTTTGGDNAYDSIYTFYRSMRPSNPTVVVGGFGQDESPTTSHYISVSSTGATEYRFKVSPADNNDNVFSAWQSSGSFTFDTTNYGVTRGDQITTVVEARSTYANAAAPLSVSNTVSYLNPDLSVAATSSTINRGDTSATSTLSSATAGHNYVVRDNNGTTNRSNILTDNGTFTLSSGLPGIGATNTYEVFAQRPVAIGGSGLYLGTNDTFTVTKYGNPTVTGFSIPSGSNVDSGTQFTVIGSFNDPQGETISWSLERKTGTGGTYAEISSGTGTMSVNQTLVVATDTTYYYRVKISALDSATITSSEINITVAEAVATTVDITSVASITPNENTSDQIEATTTTNNGVTISSYSWTKTGLITFSSTTVQNPTITFGNVTADSSASVTVTVTDSLGRTATDTQTYTIQFINQGPQAVITGTGAVLTGELVSIDGSSSFDPDGEALQYQFSATNGSETFTQAYSATDTFSYTPTGVGSYTTTLTVKDPNNATSTALFSTIVSESQDPNAGSGGGYGFEVYNAAGGTVIRSDELIIRKVKAINLDANGDGTTTVTLPDANSEILISGVGSASSSDGISYTVTTVDSTATVTVSAPSYTRVDLYMIR